MFFSFWLIISNFVQLAPKNPLFGFCSDVSLLGIPRWCHKSHYSYDRSNGSLSVDHAAIFGHSIKQMELPGVLEGWVSTLSTNSKSSLFIWYQAGFCSVLQRVSERSVNIKHQPFFFLPSQHYILPLIGHKLHWQLPFFGWRHNLQKRSVCF